MKQKEEWRQLFRNWTGRKIKKKKKITCKSKSVWVLGSNTLVTWLDEMMKLDNIFKWLI